MEKKIVDKLIRIFGSVNHTVRIMKMQATDWKIFAKEASDKRLLSTIYKEYLKLNKK